jgi:penicillin amidase
MWRRIRRIVLALAALIGMGVLVVGWSVWASLPTLDGVLAHQAIARPVRIDRDALGVVTVGGEVRADVAYGLGFAHAQDRFFQMDLMRRAAAGELSALLGQGTLSTDQRLRVHRFRTVAQAAVTALTPERRALLESYTAGVNAGLVSLHVRPFEYLLLQTSPTPWKPEDSVLVVLSMFLQLQESDGQSKIQRGLIARSVPAAVYQFIYAAATDWEASVDGSHSSPPVIPTADVFDIRHQRLDSDVLPAKHARTRPTIGSNNWAIAGSRTASGAALVANDMHLGLRLPNTWYRAQLQIGAGGRRVTGVTLPGTPGVIAGSNEHIAWGFTNSYGDYEDVIVAVAGGPDQYQTATGPKSFDHFVERIQVRGGDDVLLDVVSTLWGPVVSHDETGQPLVLEWVAHDPHALNLNILDLESAQTVAQALEIAPTAGMPTQNLVVGDEAGHIGWALMGQVPTRPAGDASVPRLSTDAAIGFSGWLTSAEWPRVVDPINGQLVTANARVVGGSALRLIGDGGYDRGARGGQIMGALASRGSQLQPADMLAVQLDDRALFLERWKTLLTSVLDDKAREGHLRRAELASVLMQWSGHAAVNDPAYRLVRGFRLEVERQLFDALIASAKEKSPQFSFHTPASFEGPLWAVLTERPLHLLPARYLDWQAFLLSAVDASLTSVADDCPRLADCTWGRANVVRIRHPLSAGVPMLSRVLDIPDEMLPGDEDMPRPQGTAFGASERFAVSPGQEAAAYFEMPGGQSGHPMSPYYRAGHTAWAQGEQTPFLPGPTRHALSLVP